MPGSMREAADHYRHTADSVVGFVEESCQLGGDLIAPRAPLYRAYRCWCSDQGRLPLAARKFHARLRDAYPDQVEEVKHKVVCFRGIGLATALDEGERE